ncbi:hypothetical protein FKP32DRAFT_588031 [Trametes sanguinea]|nr:hypothetical protein FKP32DRAFT_588031 [Trametes sanguinea]
MFTTLYRFVSIRVACAHYTLLAFFDRAFGHVHPSLLHECTSFLHQLYYAFKHTSSRPRGGKMLTTSDAVRECTVVECPPLIIRKPAHLELQIVFCVLLLGNKAATSGSSSTTHGPLFATVLLHISRWPPLPA